MDSWMPPKADSASTRQIRGIHDGDPFCIGTHFGCNFFKPEYKKNPFCCVQKGFL